MAARATGASAAVKIFPVDPIAVTRRGIPKTAMSIISVHTVSFNIMLNIFIIIARIVPVIE
jgi:hypothetical protein